VVTSCDQGAQSAPDPPGYSVGPDFSSDYSYDIWEKSQNAKKSSDLSGNKARVIYRVVYGNKSGAN